MSLKIVTANVRGLQNSKKRKEIFLYFSKIKADVVLIQESHVSEEDEHIFKSEWGGKIVFDNGDKQSKGVMIMFRHGLQVEIKKTTCSMQGRYIILDCKIGGKAIMLVNIYAPNVDTPEFFTTIFAKMSTHEHIHRIVAGDFNLVLNKAKDAYNRKINNDKSMDVINMYLEEAQLVDVFRFHNENTFRYTFFKKRPNEMYARLDYMLTNYAMMAHIDNVEILPAYKSDHAFVSMKFCLEDTKERGKGFWKLNVSILDDIVNVNRINQKIDQAKTEASQNMPCEKWEYVKQCCIQECQAISQRRAKKLNLEFKNFQKKLDKLMKQRDNIGVYTLQSTKERIESNINDCQKLLNTHLERKARGARIRSKINWYENAERSTKYFMGLEKVWSANKTLNKVINDKNEIITDQKQILKEQRLFYQKLYSEQKCNEFSYQNNGDPKLTEEQKAELDQPLTLEELGAALKQMKNGKSPGCDGLPCEFYKMFWGRLGKELWEALIDSHERGILYVTARRGIISLIPKKAKNPNYIKSWRPLTLLNVCHKILTKAIATRISGVLKDIIGKQQVGYVPGRFIGMNIRKLIDTLIYLEREDMPAVLICVDFMKCFDTINHESLYKALYFFNFGNYIISWIKLIYNSFELCTINNGKWSTYFPQQRGVHQGCGLSGPIFLCIAEILAIQIQKNKDVKGIRIGDHTETVSQYADDTMILSMFDQRSVQAIINELEKFYQNTGLQANYEKTTIYRVGQIRGSKKTLKLTKNFKWSNENISALGVIMPIDSLQEVEEINMNETIEKVRQTINTWKMRNLTLQGKIAVVNSLIASLFVYKMQVLPEMSDVMRKKVTKMISDFIWNGRKPKLKYQILTLSQENGGRKLVDILYRDKALKIEWVRRLHSPQEGDEVLTCLAYYMINTKIQNELFWQCNFNKIDAKKFEGPSQYWNNVVQAWAEVNFRPPNESNVNEVANQIVWYNTKVKIDEQLIFDEEAYEHGVLYVKDFYFNSKIMTRHELNNMYNIEWPVMKYNSIISAIPKSWRKVMVKEHQEIEQGENIGLYMTLIEKEKWSQAVYGMLTESTKGHENLKRFFMKVQGIIPSDNEIKKMFINVNKTTEISKYRSFYYRSLHGVVILNDRLAHFGIADDNKCTNCRKEKEDFKHFFIECPYAKAIWQRMKSYCLEVYDVKPNFSRENILSGISNRNQNEFVNLIIVVVKQMLYAKRCQKTTLHHNEVINEIEFIHSIELKKVKTTKDVIKYNKRWPDQIAVPRQNTEQMLIDYFM